MSESSRLRWWQEETVSEQRPYESVVSPTTVEAGGGVAVKVRDLDAELEAEAWQRVQALQNGERVEIHANPAQNLARYRKRLLLLGGPLFGFIGILETLLAIKIHSLVPLLIFPFLALELIVLERISRRLYRKQEEPVFTLTDEGIEIYGIATKVGLLRWEEIKEIRAYTYGYRYIGIIPKNTKALCRRLNPMTAFILRSNELLRYPAISLAQVNLPISADEMVKRIQDFRAARGV